MAQKIRRNTTTGVRRAAKAQSRAVTARKARGSASGIIDKVMGALPFTDDIKAFHRAKIEERAKAEKRNATFQMVIDDVYAISKGRLVGRPQALRR